MLAGARRSSVPSIALRAGLTSLCALGAVEMAFGAAVTFNTALPVAQGSFVFREQFLYSRASGDPTPAGRDMRAAGAVSVLAYGVTPEFTLFGILPVMDKRLSMTTAAGRSTRTAQGVGDVTLMGRYTAYQDNFQGGNFRIAPFGGLKLPTGRDTEGDVFGRLPPSLQLGSGSWDPMGGVVATYQTLDFEIDAQASYKHNTPANGFHFGDEARLDASLQYRLWPRHLTSGVPSFLYGVLEANLVHLAKDRLGGVDDPNSGGTKLFVDLGLQYVTKTWLLEAVVQLPVMQNLNGSALEDDIAVRGGFRVNF